MIDYKDFWLRIERRDDGFWVTSRSPAGGEMSAPLKLPPDVENFHLSMLLGAARGAVPSDATSDARRDVVFKGKAQKPEDVGSALFRALFNGPIRDAFNRNRGSGKEGGVRIRLQIDLNDPQLAKLASLPWELLYNEGTRKYLGRSKYTPIVRYLEVPLSYETYPIEGPLRVLIVLANPEGTQPLDLAREKDSIERTWAQLPGVEVTIIEHATSDAMFDKLDTGTYHVLHYMGHGGFDAESGGGVLFLEDEEGRAAPLSGTMLGETLYEMRSMRLVFLNACDTGRTSHEQGLDPFSGVASALVMAGVPAVVAMQVPVSDRAALEFAEKFYTQLAHKEPVDAAVAVGRRAIHRANPTSLEWATPVLFMRAPDGRLFAGNAEAPASKTPTRAVPVLPETGRTTDTTDVVEETVEAANAEARIAQTRSTSTLVALFSGKRKKFAISVGVTALFVVILGAFLISTRGKGEVPFTSLEQIAGIALLADAGQVLQGASVPMRIVVMDSTGRKIRTEDMSDYPLVWDPGDSTIARVVPSEFGYSASVEVLRPGKALICVGFADTSNTVRRFVAKYLMNVLPEEGGQADVYRDMRAAQNDFYNSAIEDVDVLASYERLLGEQGAVLAGVVGPEELNMLQNRVESLRSLTTLYAEVEGEDQSNTLPIVEERLHWEAFLAQADSVRKSPAKRRAAAIVDSLRTIEAEYATLVSLYLCSTGGLDCPERSRVETFAQGQRIFFSATVRLPSSGTIRWEWRGPDGSTVGEGNDSLPASSSGYRMYKYFDAESTGGYELRIYNSQEHLIGRRTFVVEPGGTGTN